jgi:3D (Asp-Asp-Asp) domain-containing protein
VIDPNSKDGDLLIRFLVHFAALIASVTPQHHHYTVSSTCYAQGGQTASGEQTRPGIVAVLPGFLPLGSWITLDRPVFGRRRYQVEDHIGEGSELDFYNPSETACLQYGRRRIGFRA